jgi:hypothetical protein
MERVQESKKMKASVIEAECMGYAVCVLQYKKQAFTLEIVRPPEHIPPKLAVLSTGMNLNVS